MADLDLPMLMFDGVHIGKHLVIVGLGIASDGTKHVLSVLEGSAESQRVCRTLLRQLIDRGLLVERRRLVIVDGSKGLAKAVKEWPEAKVQRCVQHYAEHRNMLSWGPKALWDNDSALIRSA